ncbi:hypothetical protein PCANC_09136 [Puccinia coronata f. sp. avenae]|uniref:Uncharacterized protein n=1 Tax=Puccinia coronata f. sp. avenae TaxID=200324 RepID=A0A2N5T1I8_9BASI|nr:hypothetical protein PCANC_09136 [Puccinia coronata f. sp. avenae]
MSDPELSRHCHRKWRPDQLGNLEDPSMDPESWSILLEKQLWRHEDRLGILVQKHRSPEDPPSHRLEALEQEVLDHGKELGRLERQLHSGDEVDQYGEELDRSEQQLQPGAEVNYGEELAKLQQQLHPHAEDSPGHLRPLDGQPTAESIRLEQQDITHIMEFKKRVGDHEERLVRLEQLDHRPEDESSIAGALAGTGSAP